MPPFLSVSVVFSDTPEYSPYIPAGSFLLLSLSAFPWAYAHLYTCGYGVQTRCEPARLRDSPLHAFRGPCIYLKLLRRSATALGIDAFLVAISSY